MATPKNCSKCETGAGVNFCIGCEAYFCEEDYQHHRGKMADELCRLIECGNALQDKINRATQHKYSNSSLLIQIDEWQRVTIEKVEQIAEQARQQVVKLLNSKDMEIKTQFEKFSQELIQLKETENLVERDLERLEQTIYQLNQDLKRLSQTPEIELHTERSNQIVWDSLIYVVEKSVNGKFISRPFFLVQERSVL